LSCGLEVLEASGAAGLTRPSTPELHAASPPCGCFSGDSHEQGPWTDPDPQPVDLDAEFKLLDPSAFEHDEGDPSASFGLMVAVEGEDASRLARIAEARGQKPSQVLAEFLRDADRPAA
jgi:hypothetical protein